MRGMKPAPPPDHGGAGRRSNQSKFRGWRKRHRQIQFSVAANMSDEYNRMDANKNPAMANSNAATHNNHSTVPQSTQEMSVVGPLMGVFEDLIKSSTPQVPPLGALHGTDHRPLRTKKSRLKNDSDSSTAPKRRKGKTSSDDQRWSKRFTWPDELHREFVSAIFDVGLKHASPSAIMEFMLPNPNITSERVKSHLQKYRKNRDKSRREFMTSYENSLQAFKNRSSGEDFDDDDSEDKGALTCGEAAAFCTHAVSTERGPSSYDSSMSRRSSPVPMNSPDGPTLHLPMLTTEEREGPLGQSFDCLLGLFQSLNQQLEASRNGGINSHYAARQHPNHQQSIPHSVEQAVAAASSSSMHASSSFHEVASTIPHSLSEPIHQGHHQWQGQTSRGHQHQTSQQYSSAPTAYHPQKQPPQYHSHNDIPSINYNPRPNDANVHVNPQAQPQVAAASQYVHTRPAQHAPDHASQYHAASQAQETTTKDTSPPQQSSASTTKAQKESTIMKQEMRGQRAFQNKMRALMQSEMSKYGGNDLTNGSENASHAMDHSELQQHSSNERESPHTTHEPDNPFWNIENDDDIFDFLMES